MAQTPQQRRANEQFARAEAAKRGKPTSEIKKKSTKPEKSPISPAWLYLLLFIVVGGLVFELVRIIFTGGQSYFG